MGLEGSPQESTLSAYIAVLRRRLWIVVLCTVLVPAAALFFSLRQPAEFSSTAEVYINKQNLASALTGIEDTTLFVDEERAAETQASLASVPAVARRALDLAGVDDLTPDDLIAQTSIAPKGLTDIIEFTVVDGDADLAERLASAYAQAFTLYRGELDTRAIVKAREEVTAALTRLDAEGRQDTDLHASLEESQQQLQTLETLQTSRAYVIREADEAVQIAPTPMRNAILGVMLGLVLGVGLAFLVDALDTRVRSASEVGERLGLPLLARIPAPPKELARDDHLVMMARPHGTHAEAFRMLRTNLEFARLEGEGVRTLLVTSAVEQEGKSTTAANLAVALARAGSRVALVDLDLRRPYVARFFMLLHAHGVTDVALGKVSLATALQPIDLGVGQGGAAPPNGNGRDDDPAGRGALDVLVSGPLPPDPGEFVGTERLAAILRELHASYDTVIVDTPPLLRVGDAMTLSSQADGVLVVSRLHLVRRPMLNELRRLLEAAPAPKLGFVATGGRKESEAYGAAYGYHYGYGYGPRTEEAGAPVQGRKGKRREREGVA